MNTAKRTLVSAAIFAAALVLCSTTHANPLNGMPEGTKEVLNVLRVDTVNTFFVASVDTANVLQRTISAGTNGQYMVQVAAPNGTLMMEGSYADVQCTVQHGTFTYYYSNGQVSAKGAYTMGVKAGIWQRFDAQGKALAERVYTGLNWEQTQIQLGLASKASMKP